MTIFEALTYATEQLHAILDNRTATQEAYWLVAKTVNKPTSYLISNRSAPLTAQQEAWLATALNDRITGHKPLGYILGSVPFCSLEIPIEPPILIPRHETEEWVDELIRLIPHNIPLTVLDLCTGSGCIALAIGKHRPFVSIVGIDILPQAVALAQKNKELLAPLPNVTFMESDLYTNLTSYSFDMIISNPPYLAASEWNDLDAGVRNWESPLALVSDEHDGADLYRRIIQQASQYLAPRNEQNKNLPELVLEHGHQQSEIVGQILTSHGFSIQKHKIDLFDKARVIYSSRSS